MPKDMDRLTSQLNHIPSVIAGMGLSIAEAQKELNADYITSLHRVVLIVNRMLRGLNMPEVPEAEAKKATTAVNEAQGDLENAKTALGGDPDDEAKKTAVTNATMKLADANAALDRLRGYTESKLAAVKMLLEAMAPSRYQYTESTLDFSADLAESFDLGVDAAFGAGLSGVTVSAGLALSFGYDYRAAARMTAKIHAIHPNATMTEKLLARAKEVDTNHKGTLPAAHSHDKKVMNRSSEAFKSLTGGSEIAPDKDGELAGVK